MSKLVKSWVLHPVHRYDDVGFIIYCCSPPIVVMLVAGQVEATWFEAFILPSINSDLAMLMIETTSSLSALWLWRMKLGPSFFTDSPPPRLDMK